MSEDLLEVEDLSVQFDTARGSAVAVDHLSFSVGEAETLAVVGESGSGKSATALSILGLVPSPPGDVIGGKIRFRRREGRQVDLLQISRRTLRKIRGNEIAMIFQEPLTSLSPVYTIGDQIAETIRLHQGRSRPRAMRDAIELLHSLGISEPRLRARNYPHEISGGMAQRVMIAMALACRPRLLIADEPTTALDVTIQAEILELIKNLKREIGMAVLFITHNLGVVAEIADRVAVIYAGRLVEIGPASIIFSASRMPYTEALLSAVPRLVTDARALKLDAIPGEPPSPFHHPKGCAFHPRCKYALPGVCDQATPPLRDLGDEHLARCIRIDEIYRGA